MKNKNKIITRKSNKQYKSNKQRKTIKTRISRKHSVQHKKKILKGGNYDEFVDLTLPKDEHYVYIGTDVQNIVSGDMVSGNIVSGDIISKMDFKGKNVGIIAGCFCPPHKGHYQTIYDACAKNKLDYMFIHTMNNSNAIKSRHGVPALFSVKMLSYFAKNINKYLGTQFFISNTSQSIPWDINNSMNKIYMIDVVEMDGEPTESNMEYVREREDTDPLANAARRYLINFKPNVDKKVQYSVLFRNKLTSISATSFIKSIIKYRDGSIDDLRESISYLPDFIDESTKIQIIKDIIKDYGEYLK